MWHWRELYDPRTPLSHASCVLKTPPWYVIVPHASATHAPHKFR
jgi:hypothetical protein